MDSLNTQAITQLPKSKTYVGASVVFRFTPNSPYSKFSKQYGVDLRVLLAEKTKQIIQKESQENVTTQLDYIWFDSEAEHLDAYPSVLEIGGYAITDGITPKEALALRWASEDIEKELEKLFPNWVEFTANMYYLTDGEFLQIGNWKI